jgi:hypothetical protein
MTKSMNAWEKAVIRFTWAMGLSHRAATHTAQKNYHKTMEESRHFIEEMRDKVADRDRGGNEIFTKNKISSKCYFDVRNL